MKLNTDFNIAVTAEYEGQDENVIAKCTNAENAVLIANSLASTLSKAPIFRIVDLENEKCLHSFKKAFKIDGFEKSAFEK